MIRVAWMVSWVASLEVVVGGRFAGTVALVEVVAEVVEFVVGMALVEVRSWL